MSGTIIHVGGDTPQFTAFADYLDGESAVVRRASITVKETPSGPVLVILPPEMPNLHWPLTDIRTVPDQAGRDTLVLALSDNPVSRLIVADPEARQILTARSRNLKKRPTVKGRGRLLAWAAAAVASVALIIWVLVPVMADQLAGYLPPEGERALGESTFAQIRTMLADSEMAQVQVCDNPSGRSALEQMQGLLEAQTDLPYPIKIHVLNHDLVNAFALPGGRIVLFKGLIDAAETPDEVAAVLSHEIGHVVHRDPARGALRSAGSIGVLGLLFGDFAGGFAVTFMLERLIDATYSQEAEAAADEFAHATLAKVGILPSSLATFFTRMQEKYGDSSGLVTHFQAHPSLGDRIEVARAADANMSAEIRPSLQDAEWRALRNICR